MVKEASSDLYSLIFERIFFKHFQDGRTSIWKRDELLEAANELNVRAPKNLGDLIYAFRYRRTLPESIRAAAPEGMQWIIGSSELSVGGGVEASCDEEHSELVVGGVAVASGGASA